jgi:hypothetical protein
MHQVVETACQYWPMTLIVGCFMLGMVLKTFQSVVTSNSRERSRREIAAYIAEGTLSPDQGERILRADVNQGRVT